jgi:dCTP deaminase
MIITNSERIMGFFEKNNFDEERFKKNGWSYDLSLGEEVFLTSMEYPIILSDSQPYVNIKPGEFALLITYEKLNLPPNIMAFISVRFTYKKKGLINISGFHVDPNYKGKIIFSVYNAGPNDIVLKYKEPVFMIFFEELEDAVKEDQKRPPGYNHIEPSMISEIKGQSVSLVNNYHKIEQLEFSMKLYGGIAIAIITTLIGILLTKIV